MALGAAVVGRKYKSAVDLLPAPAEEGLPTCCFSAREGLGALETLSFGESARMLIAVFFRDDKKSSDTSSNLSD
jgi:hypothetical protein